MTGYVGRRHFRYVSSPTLPPDLEKCPSKAYPPPTHQSSPQTKKFWSPLPPVKILHPQCVALPPGNKKAPRVEQLAGLFLILMKNKGFFFILLFRYDPHFTVDLQCKDLRLGYELSQTNGVPLKVLGLAEQIYNEAKVKYGKGKKTFFKHFISNQNILHILAIKYFGRLCNYQSI